MSKSFAFQIRHKLCRNGAAGDCQVERDGERGEAAAAVFVTDPREYHREQGPSETGAVECPLRRLLIANRFLSV